MTAQTKDTTSPKDPQTTLNEARQALKEAYALLERIAARIESDAPDHIKESGGV